MLVPFVAVLIARLVTQIMSVLVLSVMQDFTFIMGYVIINVLLKLLLQHLVQLKYVLTVILHVQHVQQHQQIVLLVQQQVALPTN